MIVIQCEKCSSSFNLDASKIPPSGTKGKCGKCGHIFTVHAPATESQNNFDLNSMIMSVTGQGETQAPAQNNLSSTPNIPPVAQGAYKVSQEAMLKHQSKAHQSFKKQASSDVKSEQAEPHLKFTSKENQRYAKVIFAMAFLAATFTLVIRSNAIHPTYVLTSLAHKQPVVAGKLNLLSSNIVVFRSSSLEHYLKVSGTLLNTAHQPIVSTSIVVETYDPNGNTITSKRISCCDQLIQPGIAKIFKETFAVPENKTISSYKISLN